MAPSKRRRGETAGQYIGRESRNFAVRAAFALVSGIIFAAFAYFVMRGLIAHLGRTLQQPTRALAAANTTARGWSLVRLNGWQAGEHVGCDVYASSGALSVCGTMRRDVTSVEELYAEVTAEIQNEYPSVTLGEPEWITVASQPALHFAANSPDSGAHDRYLVCYLTAAQGHSYALIGQGPVKNAADLDASMAQFAGSFPTASAKP